MREINYEWEIEYERECVRSILSESMCVRMRKGEIVVCLCVCEREIKREKLCKCVKERDYERMSERAIE